MKQWAVQREAWRVIVQEHSKNIEWKMLNTRVCLSNSVLYAFIDVYNRKSVSLVSGLFVHTGMPPPTGVGIGSPMHASGVDRKRPSTDPRLAQQMKLWVSGFLSTFRFDDLFFYRRRCDLDGYICKLLAFVYVDFRKKKKKVADKILPQRVGSFVYV